MLDAREEASAYFPGRMIHDTRRVRPANFKKWIQVGEERLVTQACIDSGANGNTMSYQFYKQLMGVELRDTTTMLKSFLGHKTRPHGFCMLQVFVDELSCGDKFFVTQVGL